jgi:hypothetical protein
LGGKLGKSLTSWITEQSGLTYAQADEGLRRSRLDKFKFEGREYSREPHIKLDDHVSPNRVGRIYFAVDFKNL